MDRDEERLPELPCGKCQGMLVVREGAWCGYCRGTIPPAEKLAYDLGYREGRMVGHSEGHRCKDLDDEADCG